MVEDELPRLRGGTSFQNEVPGASGGSEDGCEAFCSVSLTCLQKHACSFCAGNPEIVAQASNEGLNTLYFSCSRKVLSPLCSKVFIILVKRSVPGKYCHGKERSRCTLYVAFFCPPKLEDDGVEVVLIMLYRLG